MTITSFKSIEPLYIVIVRHKNAQKMLSDWATANKCHANIESNRMKLYEYRSLVLFRMEWPHSWDDLVIWDCWNKKHLDT